MLNASGPSSSQIWPELPIQHQHSASVAPQQAMSHTTTPRRNHSFDEHPTSGTNAIGVAQRAVIGAVGTGGQLTSAFAAQASSAFGGTQQQQQQQQPFS
jgi:hypothetical protein